MILFVIYALSFLVVALFSRFYLKKDSRDGLAIMASFPVLNTIVALMLIFAAIVGILWYIVEGD